MTTRGRFLVMTVVITSVIGGLFLIVVFAPEPWQTRPWTLWEHCAKWLFFVLGWPLWAAAMALDRLSWRMSDWFAGVFFPALFVVSGAFWSAVIEVVRARIKRTPKKAL